MHKNSKKQAIRKIFWSDMIKHTVKGSAKAGSPNGFSSKPDIVWCSNVNTINHFKPLDELVEPKIPHENSLKWQVANNPKWLINRYDSFISLSLGRPLQQNQTKS